MCCGATGTKRAVRNDRNIKLKNVLYVRSITYGQLQLPRWVWIMAFNNSMIYTALYVKIKLKNTVQGLEVWIWCAEARNVKKKRNHDWKLNRKSVSSSKIQISKAIIKNTYLIFTLTQIKIKCWISIWKDFVLDYYLE